MSIPRFDCWVICVLIEESFFFTLIFIFVNKHFFLIVWTIALGRDRIDWGMYRLFFIHLSVAFGVFIVRNSITFSFSFPPFCSLAFLLPLTPILSLPLYQFLSCVFLSISYIQIFYPSFLSFPLPSVSPVPFPFFFPLTTHSAFPMLFHVS